MPSLRCRRGLTLLELTIALIISAVILAAFFEILRRARTSSDSAVTQAQVTLDANDLLQRIADELRLSGPGSPDWALGADGQETVITYNRCLGASGGTLQWEAPRSLAVLPLEGQEQLLGSNGLDDDNNGLVDEHRLVLQDPETLEVREVWSRCLLPGGLRLDVKDHLVTITVSLQVPAEKAGSPPFRTQVHTDVSLRN